MNKFLLWVDKQTALEKIKPAFENLAKLGKTQVVQIVGATGEEPTSIVINGQKASWIPKEEICRMNFDGLLFFGGGHSFSEMRKRAKEFGVEENKLIPGSAVCIPGFTLERYRKLKSSKLSIVSMNCFGGLAYHTFGLPFLSPTINMFWPPEHFLKFISDFRRYMDMELRYYKEGYDETLKTNYPIFHLGDCEIWMNHYGVVGKDVARAKWEERRMRMNWYNILVVAATTSREWAEKFDALPFAKKVCFTNFESDLESAYCIEYCRDSKKTITLSANDYAMGKYQCYDFWEILLYGKKVRLQ